MGTQTRFGQKVMSNIIYHSNFFAKQPYGLDRKFLRTPLYTINNSKSIVNCCNNYSKFPNVFYPTLIKILVYWLDQRCKMVNEYIPRCTGVVLLNKTNVNGLGGLNFLNNPFHRLSHKIHGIIHKSKKSICTIDSEFRLKLFYKERKQLVWFGIWSF